MGPADDGDTDGGPVSAGRVAGWADDLDADLVHGLARAYAGWTPDTILDLPWDLANALLERTVRDRELERAERDLQAAGGGPGVTAPDDHPDAGTMRMRAAQARAIARQQGRG